MRELFPVLLVLLAGGGCQSARDGAPPEPPARAEKPARTAPHCEGSYIACGCGCCPGVEPEVRCLSCVKGDELQALIAEDRAKAADPSCPMQGCSAPVKYLYCDEPR